MPTITPYLWETESILLQFIFQFLHPLPTFTPLGPHLQKFRDICSPFCDHESLRASHMVLPQITEPLNSVGGQSTAASAHLNSEVSLMVMSENTYWASVGRPGLLESLYRTCLIHWTAQYVGNNQNHSIMCVPHSDVSPVTGWKLSRVHGSHLGYRRFSRHFKSQNTVLIQN